MDKKTPGRPRVYATTAEKVGAFRHRQESAGYSRKEILVTTDTSKAISTLAAQNQVNGTDVASALVELGLKTYLAEHTGMVAEVTSAQTLAHYASMVRASECSGALTGNVSGALMSTARSGGLPAIGEPLQTPVINSINSGAVSATNPILEFLKKRKDLTSSN